VRKVPLILATGSFLLAAVILVVADGARSLYSGAFFAVLGAVLLARARRGGRDVPR
jgi:hypothetical protein